MRTSIDRGALAPGTLVGGIELLEEIGVGGSAIVYRGRLSDGRIVAVKERFPAGSARGDAGDVLWPPGLREDALGDARREALILDRLDGADAPKLLFPLSANGTHYLVMEYVRGEPLDIWASGRRRDGDFPASLRCVAERLLRRFALLHAAGVVHGDAAPPNVLIREGAPVLIDFGGGGGVRIDRPIDRMAVNRHDRTHYRPPAREAPYDPATLDVFGVCASLYDAWRGRAPDPSFDPPARRAASRLLADGALVDGAGAGALARALDLGLGAGASADAVLATLASGEADASS